MFTTQVSLTGYSGYKSVNLSSSVALTVKIILTDLIITDDCD